MTAQFSEVLHHEGQQHSMCTNPLEDYFALGGFKPNFKSNCTALWRGYVGTWEIIEDRLYLIELHGTIEGGEVASLATIFPDFPDRVFAHWYSGTLRIPQGKMLHYEHMGYESIYERDLLLEIEKGVLKSATIRQNGISSNDNAPEGYGIGAMTVFSRKQKHEDGAT